MKFEIPIEPKPQSRPRASVRGSHATVAMISLYRFGAPRAKLEAKKWLQKVMEGVG